jgi:acetyl-CoA synthetase
MTTIDPEQPADSPHDRFGSHCSALVGLYQRADDNRLKFWAEEARELLWAIDFDEVLDWSNPPFAKWFVGGEINVTVNCVDRHVLAGKGDRVAIHWVGEPGDSRAITYRQLQRQVIDAATYFNHVGLRAGDRVAIYMPLIPEAIVAMLACARLGLVHLVVPTGAAAGALRAQLDDAQAKLVITSDGHYRQGVACPLKSTVDEALAGGDAPSEIVEAVIVVRRTGHDPELRWMAGRDVWWQDTVGATRGQHEAQAFDSEHPLFLLYTSDAAGNLKGIVHSAGGYLTQTRHTFDYVFDHREGEDVFWCGADLGSIAGHSYLVYGPLSAGATSVIYEGAADFPTRQRHFQIIEDYGVTTYYVAPAVIATYRRWGREIPDAHDLSSLRVLGTMCERDREVRRWCQDVLGGNRCRVADTWWQTETGAIMIAPLPGATAREARAPARPLPGISAHVVSDDGDLVEWGGRGTLVLDRPWPSMTRGIWGDGERFVRDYWSRFGEWGWYDTGVDAGYGDDDVIWLLSLGENVSGASRW